MVGEVFLLSTEAVATYYGHDDELHLAFKFPPLFAPWLADRWAGCIETPVGRSTPGVPGRPGCCPTTTTPATAPATTGPPRRAGEDPATTARRSEPRARAAAVLLLTLRGTPSSTRATSSGWTTPTIPRTGGSIRRTRRLPGPDPLGRVARPRLADRRRGDHLAAVPPGAGRPEPGGVGGRPGVDPPPLPAGHLGAARHSGAGAGRPRCAASPDGTSPSAARSRRRRHGGRQLQRRGGRRHRTRDGRCRGAAGLGRPRAGQRVVRNARSGPGGRAAALTRRCGRAAPISEPGLLPEVDRPKSPSDMVWSRRARSGGCGNQRPDPRAVVDAVDRAATLPRARLGIARSSRSKLSSCQSRRARCVLVFDGHGSFLPLVVVAAGLGSGSFAASTYPGPLGARLTHQFSEGCRRSPVAGSSNCNCPPATCPACTGPRTRVGPTTLRRSTIVRPTNRKLSGYDHELPCQVHELVRSPNKRCSYF